VLGARDGRATNYISFSRRLIDMGGKKSNNYNKGGKASMTMDEAMAELASRFVVNTPTEEQESINRCMWQVEAAHWFYDDIFRRHHRELPFMNFKEFAVAFFKECPSMSLDQESLSRALNLFQKYKKRVPVCGAIMLNAAMTRCVLVKGWGKCSAWGFPKGKINQEESKLECAIREVEEETGYNCSSHIDPADHIELSIRQQTIRLYLATNVPENVSFKTQTRKEIGDIQWVTLHGLQDGSIEYGAETSSKKKKASADESFFTGDAFLEPLMAWINARSAGQQVPETRYSVKKNRSRANSQASLSSTDGPGSQSSSDSEGSNKSGVKKKKKQGRLDKDRTFGSTSEGGWSVEDMFAVNEQKFGIVDSYDESLYTTKLPAEYMAQKKTASSAKRSARSRSNSTSNNGFVQPASAPVPQVSAAPQYYVYSVEQPYPITNNNLSKSTAGCTNALTSGAPIIANASTPLPSAAPLMEFSFNREEILSCF
jgi:mRNA-decapping enzyme subunit 2